MTSWGRPIIWTLALQLPSIIVGWFIGNLLGALAAYIRKGVDKALLPIFMFISNIPTFGLGMVFLWLFASQLHWFPVGGGYAPSMTAPLEHGVRPLRFGPLPPALPHHGAGSPSAVRPIGMRSMSIYELNADYVKYSRFLGIRDHKIVGYVFRNAMLPQVTGLALSLGTMVGATWWLKWCSATPDRQHHLRFHFRAVTIPCSPAVR